MICATHINCEAYSFFCVWKFDRVAKFYQLYIQLIDQFSDSIFKSFTKTATYFVKAFFTIPSCNNQYSSNFFKIFILIKGTHNNQDYAYNLYTNKYRLQYFLIEMLSKLFWFFKTSMNHKHYFSGKVVLEDSLTILFMVINFKPLPAESANPSYFIKLCLILLNFLLQINHLYLYD